MVCDAHDVDMIQSSTSGLSEMEEVPPPAMPTTAITGMTRSSGKRVRDMNIVES